MPTPETVFVTLLRTRILPNVHLVALAVSGLGLCFHLMKYNGASELIMLGLSALAGVYFLTAFIMVQVPIAGKPNVYSFILYKVLYIASSVTVIGILFYLLRFAGVDQMLLMGCGGLGLGVLAALALSAANRDNFVILKTPLLRASGLLLLGIYFMRQLNMF